MKWIGTLAVSALLFSSSTSQAGLLETLFANPGVESGYAAPASDSSEVYYESAEMLGGPYYGGGSYYGGHTKMRGFGANCGPCYGWHPRSCQKGSCQKGSCQKGSCQKGSCQKSAPKCAQKAPSKCYQKAAPKYVQKPHYVQKHAPKYVQKGHCQKSAAQKGHCQKAAPKSVQKCAPKAAQKAPCVQKQAKAAKCNRPSWLSVFHRSHCKGKGKGKDDGKGFSTILEDGTTGSLEAADPGVPPQPELNEGELNPVGGRSASLRLFPGNLTLLPVRIGG